MSVKFKQIEDFTWELTAEEFPNCKNILRDLTGQDFIYAASINLFDCDSPLVLLALYDRLVISEEFVPTDLPLKEYGLFCELFNGELIKERLFSPDNFMELIYFLQGEQFSPNVQEWFKVPITLMLSMRKVLENNPRQKLV